MENELNKMTAVQWFIEQLEQKGDASENLFVRRVQISIDVSDYLDLKRQAKEMEKEQIMDASGSGWSDGVLYSNGEIWNYQSPEHYYTETYGGNNGK
jgi:hypothetical protein